MPQLAETPASDADQAGHEDRGINTAPEPAYVQQWRDRGFHIQLHKGNYCAYDDARVYIGSLNSSGELIVKVPYKKTSSKEESAVNLLSTKLVTKWENSGCHIQVINGRCYVCVNRVFKGVLLKTGQLVDSVTQLPKTMKTSTKSAAECALTDTMREYIQNWRDRGYRILVQHGKGYVYEFGVYIGTLGENGELIAKSSLMGLDIEDAAVTHYWSDAKLESARELCHRGYRILDINGMSYVSENRVVIAYLGEDGELIEHFCADNSQNKPVKKLQHAILDYLIDGRPGITGVTDYAYREVGFTLSLMSFLDENWTDLYGGKSLNIFREIVLSVSPFSFLMDVPTADEENERTIGQLIASKGALQAILRHKTGMPIDALYSLMGNVCMLYTPETAVLTSLSDAQQHFCKKHGIRLYRGHEVGQA